MRLKRLLVLVVLPVLGLVGQEKKEPIEKLAPYYPTPETIVQKMLQMGGLKAGEKMFDLGSGGLILMASERGVRGARDPIALVTSVLAQSLAVASAAGIDASRIVVDPGIGFFRRQGIAWHEWDAAVLGAAPRPARARATDLRRCLPQVLHRRPRRRGRSGAPPAGLARRHRGGGSCTAPSSSAPTTWRRRCRR